MRDISKDITVEQSLAPAARTADANGTGVDLANFDGATVVVDAGAWTDGAHTFTVEESDDDSTYSAVADADLVGTEPVIDAADEDEQVYLVGYIGTKRYIRVAVAVASATTGAVYGASVIRGLARKLPA